MDVTYVHSLRVETIGHVICSNVQDVDKIKMAAMS